MLHAQSLTIARAVDHSARMDELPDEYLAETLPLAKKIAKALGVVDYNILQVSYALDCETTSRYA